MRAYTAFAVMLLVLLLAACTTPTEAPAVATDVPTDEAVTDLPAATDTLPPPPAITGPTLPPTWTPTPPRSQLATATLVPTIAVTSANAEDSSDAAPPPTSPPQPTLPQECEAFRLDSTRMVDEFPMGEPVTLYWVPIAIADSYRIRVYNPAGEVVLTEFVASDVDQFVVPAEIFTAEAEFASLAGYAVFGWDNVAIDDQGIQFCDAIGGELIATTD